VLDTGDRQVVFVQLDGGRFEPREVETGHEGDEYVEIRKGVAAGEQVVTSANFLIDSESRFQAAARDFGGGGHD
jgi:Cu(I)/Ag(I) efflux system membrane fusion protein